MTNSTPVLVTPRQHCPLLHALNPSTALSLLLSEGDTGTYWRPDYIHAEVTGIKASILVCEKRAHFEKGWIVLLQGQP